MTGVAVMAPASPGAMRMRNRHTTPSFPAVETPMPVEATARVDEASTFGSGHAACEPLHPVRSAASASAKHAPVLFRKRLPREA